MKNFVVHNDVGMILRAGSCPEDMFDIQARNGEVVIEGSCDDTQHYVSNGEVVIRPENTTVLDGNVLSNIPSNSKLLIEGCGIFDVTEGTVTLDFSDIGKYRVTVQSWPYLDKTFEVIV